MLKCASAAVGRCGRAGWSGGGASIVPAVQRSEVPNVMSFFVHRSSARLSQHSSRCLPQAGDPQYTHTLHPPLCLLSDRSSHSSWHSRGDRLMLVSPHFTTSPPYSVCSLRLAYESHVSSDETDDDAAGVGSDLFRSRRDDPNQEDLDPFGGGGAAAAAALRTAEY